MGAGTRPRSGIIFYYRNWGPLRVICGLIGENKWPIETCRIVSDDLDQFVEVARTVGFTRDGAVVISADGTIQEQMVRVKSQSEVGEEERIDYADWMGTKHLSAIEVSVRSEVLAAITLSEENGRVTVLQNGRYKDYKRDELGGEWRPTE